MGPLETITAALMLANTIATLRLEEFRALPPEQRTADVLRRAQDQEKMIADLRTFAQQLRDDADKVGKLFGGLGDKIHAAINPDPKP